MFFAQSCYNKNMSAKDAPGEVNKNPNFDSPNITSAADEVMEMIDAEKAARKKAETVEIDGVPIDEKEVKFKAEDIKKKGKTEYFVNVEGAEQRKREAQRRAKLEAEEAKKRAKADDERVINELHKKAEQRKRENREVEQKAKAEDNRVIGELHKKAEKRKKENRAAKRKERNKKLRNFFFKGWHKFVTIGVVLTAIACVVIFAVIPYFQSEADRKEQEEIAKSDKEMEELLKTDQYLKQREKIEEAAMYFANYNFEFGDLIYKNILAETDDEEAIAKLYLRKSKDEYNFDSSEGKIVSINDAKESFKHNPYSVECASWLARIYTEKGDETQAQYYRDKMDEALQKEKDESATNTSTRGEG